MIGNETTIIKARANLDVLGWTADQCALNEPLAEEIVRYVEGALRAGLPAGEIELDLVAQWGALFSSVSVDATYACRKAVASIFAVAAPRVAAPVLLNQARPALI